jgi:hypothetical protein
MKTYNLGSFMNYRGIVRFLTFILIILTALPGCGTKRESPVELYKEAETLQKQAEDFYEKRDYDNALHKYQLAIEKAKESAKSDWNLPNFLIEKCEKGIVLVEKKAEDQGLVCYDGRYIAIEEKKEKEEQEQRRKEEEIRKQRETEEAKPEWIRNPYEAGYKVGQACAKVDCGGRDEKSMEPGLSKLGFVAGTPEYAEFLRGFQDGYSDYQLNRRRIY